MFKSLFGKKKQTPNTAIDKLRESVSNLEKREIYLEKLVTTLRNQASLCKSTNKEKAISCLKTAKLHEKQLLNICNLKSNLEVQICTITQALINKDLISAMNMGKEVMKDMKGSIDPDKVAEVMDDLEELKTDVDEVSTIMSKPIGEYQDDDDLLKELEDEEEVVKMNKKILLPKVPTTQLPVTLPSEAQINQDLAELQDLMS